MKQYRTLSLIKDAPSFFEQIEVLKGRDLRRFPFIVLLEDFEGFKTLFEALFPKITGIIVWLSDQEEVISLGKTLYLYRFNQSVSPQLWPILQRQLDTLIQLRKSNKERIRLDLDHERLKKDMKHISSYISVVDNLVKTNFDQQTQWMVEALTRLVNFAAVRLKGLPVNQFPKAIIHFLADSFFDYQAVGLYKYSDHRRSWVLLDSHGNLDDIEREIDNFSFNFSEYWTKGRLYYHRVDLDNQSFMLSLIKRKALTSFSNYEHSFFSMMVTLGGSFYHLKRLTLDIQEKIIEISNIRTSASIVSGLKENKLTLKKAMLELYISLSLEGLVLGKVKENDFLHEIIMQKGGDFKRWQEVKDLVVAGDHGWILFDLDDEQGYHHGTVAFRLSMINLTLKAIQIRVLEHTIPQIILVLSEKRFHEESITDPLTGLYNRRYLLKILQERSEMIKDDPSYSLVVMIIDLDYFRLVNDTYGHSAGDYILCYISELLKNMVRDIDIVARYGGEEFMVVISAPLDIVRNISQRMRQRIEQSNIIFEGESIAIKASFGLAMFRKDLSVEQVITEADLNLYRAKKEGRNRVIG